MPKQTKEMVSVRLDPLDRRRIKLIADRLKVNESDLVRYAIKAMLEDLSPITDTALEGIDLLPVFLNNAPNKSRWLGLDENRLDAILHEDLQDESLRVSKEDLKMLIGGPHTQGFMKWWRTLFDGKGRTPVGALSVPVYLDDKYLEPLRNKREALELANRPRRKR